MSEGPKTYGKGHVGYSPDFTSGMPPREAKLAKLFVNASEERRQFRAALRVAVEMLAKYELSSCDGCHTLREGPSHHCGMCGKAIIWSDEEHGEHMPDCEWVATMAALRAALGETEP